MQSNYKNLTVTTEAKELFCSYTADIRKTKSECLIAMIQFFLLNGISPFGREQLASRIVMEQMENGFKRVEALFPLIRSFEKNINEKLSTLDDKSTQIGIELSGVKGIHKIAGNMTQADIEKLIGQLQEAQEERDYLQKKITELQNGKGYTGDDITRKMYAETEKFLHDERCKEEGKMIWRHTNMQVNDFLNRLRQIGNIKD